MMILCRGGVIVLLLLRSSDHLAEEEGVQIQLVRAIPKGAEVWVIDKPNDRAFAKLIRDDASAPLKALKVLRVDIAADQRLIRVAQRSRIGILAWVHQQVAVSEDSDPRNVVAVA